MSHHPVTRCQEGHTVRVTVYVWDGDSEYVEAEAEYCPICGTELEEAES
jgi:hypothetical protein